MEFYQYLLLVIVWVLGAVYGWYARERHAKRTIGRYFSQFTEETTREIPHIVITVEKHNGAFFIYNKETSEFMAQGTTRKEINDILVKRYPGVYFAITSENQKVLNEPF